MAKDQSYVLGVLTQEQLAHSLFPLGDTPKPEIREEAERRGIAVAAKPDSHDICFISDGDTGGWLSEKLVERSTVPARSSPPTARPSAPTRAPGATRSASGEGLRIGTPAADGQPRYVLDIEPVSGTVTVGPRAELAVDGLSAIRPRWCGAVPTARWSARCSCARTATSTARWCAVDGEPARASTCSTRRPGIAPGQAVVVYDGSRVVGSATISATRRAACREPLSTRATGIGSMPGEDFREAVRLVLGELPDLPHLPELPARGATAGMTGRAAALVAELGFDLQPAGWRLTDAPGVDHRRARSLLAQDLDVLEEQTQGYAGPLKLQVAGPWTLASTVEKPRGDKVLSDVGARRDLAQALAEGVRDHLADVRRRVPGAELLLQVDEPALPLVLAGRVPTASGFHRHRSVDAAGRVRGAGVGVRGRRG